MNPYAGCTPRHQLVLIYTEDGTIKPVYPEDLPIFKHCTDGRSEVSSEYFRDEMKSVLEGHGISPRLLKHGEKP